MASWKETICVVLASISAGLLPIFSWEVGRIIIVFMALMYLLRFAFEDIRAENESHHKYLEEKKLEEKKRRAFNKWFYDNREK